MDSDLEWKSFEWGDGSMYEGLAKNNVIHSHGVMQYPNGDRYEGEFVNGRQNGYGVYIWRNGMIYRGEWMEGIMHGCGVNLWQTEDKGFEAAEGKFMGGEFLGQMMTCSRETSTEVAVEADYAAALARSLQTQHGKSRRKELMERAQHPPAGPTTSTSATNNLPWPFSLFKKSEPNTNQSPPQKAAAPSSRISPAATPKPTAQTAGGSSGASASHGTVISKFDSLKQADQQSLSRAVDKIMAREVGLLQLPESGSQPGGNGPRTGL